MQINHWDRVKLVVEQALEQPPPLRSPFIAQACRDDTHVRAEVESLLELADDDAEDFLESPAVLPPTWASPSASSQREGQQVGPYRILRKLGAGGMGEVYLSERQDLLRPDELEEVVLKMPRHDLDTPALRRRLEHEGRLLGRLDHPGIVRLRGSGQSGSLPYLVLEHVEGVALDVWCRLHALGVGARIDLVRSLCDAVAHAHSRGVVHRDVKSSNVLVTSQGQPKLLDFGIAQELRNDPAAAGGPAPAAMFSSESAAPEQVRNQPPTAATDVYGLGALTYRLLTGLPPHDTRTHTTVVDTLRAICHQDPMPASQRVLQAGWTPEWGLPDAARLSECLAGNIDVLLATALTRDPTQRHADVGAFARALSHCRPLS